MKTFTIMILLFCVFDSLMKENEELREEHEKCYKIKPISRSGRVETKHANICPGYTDRKFR